MNYTKDKFYKETGSSWSRWEIIKALAGLSAICLVFITVAYIYDLGVKQGQISALSTAYEVCRKVAPCK